MSVTEQSNGLALRLKQETAVDHEHMHVLMEKAAVFLNQENYSKFTLAQYYFQKDIEHLFADENLILDGDVEFVATFAVPSYDGNVPSNECQVWSSNRR